MVKIAVSSDNHFDINKVDLTPTIQAQAAFLTDQSVDDYLIAGDLFNDFTKSAAYVKQLSINCQQPRCILLPAITT